MFERYVLNYFKLPDVRNESNYSRMVKTIDLSVDICEFKSRRRHSFFRFFIFYFCAFEKKRFLSFDFWIRRPLARTYWAVTHDVKQEIKKGLLIWAGIVRGACV